MGSGAEATPFFFFYDSSGARIRLVLGDLHGRNVISKRSTPSLPSCPISVTGETFVTLEALPKITTKL